MKLQRKIGMKEMVNIRSQGLLKDEVETRMAGKAKTTAKARKSAPLPIPFHLLF